MRPALLRPAQALVFSGACVLAACSASSHTFTTGAGGAGSGSTGNGGPGGGFTSGTGGSPNFTATGTGAGTTSSGGGSFIAYAHTNNTLFKIDPTQANLGVTSIGGFDCIGGAGQDSSMTDLAVDATGDLWGVTAHHVYHLVIMGSKVACGPPIVLPMGATFYGLTFAPTDVTGLSKEILVAGNTKGELYTVDTMGATVLLGDFGNVPSGTNAGKPWQLSGDIVFLSNNGNPVGFATVRDCKSTTSSSGCDKTDTLIEIDVAAVKTAITSHTPQSLTASVRGKIVKKAGCSDTVNTSYGSMFGIAAWNDKVYGFSHKGDIVEIDNNDGTACLVVGGMDLWDGAAVTTSAPVIKPPN